MSSHSVWWHGLGVTYGHVILNFRALLREVGSPEHCAAHAGSREHRRVGKLQDSYKDTCAL